MLEKALQSKSEHLEVNEKGREIIHEEEPNGHVRIDSRVEMTRASVNLNADS